MTVPPTTTRPRDRRWKRWVALVLIGGAGFAWISNRESETVRRAAGLRVGMPRSEVDAIMGEPFIKTQRAKGELVTFYGTAFERMNFDSRSGLYSLFSRLGLTSIDVRMLPPVVVEFDDKQRAAIWFTNGRRDPRTIPAGSSHENGRNDLRGRML